VSSSEEFRLTLERLLATQDLLREETRRRELLERRLDELEQSHRLTADNLRRDLALAREIQKSLLPEPAPRWDGLDLRCFSSSALEIGGDFYTHRASSNARVLLSKYVLAVGDVSGKGVSAALLMATTLSRFDAALSLKLGPAELLAHLDRELLPYTKPRRQSCALCYVEVVGVNTVRPLLRTANAGCVPPYLKHADGSVEWIDTGGPPLGQGLGARNGYREVVRPLAAGDLVVLTSDGVVEARDHDDELFGFSRLEAAIADGPAQSPEAMLERLRSEVAAFLGDREPHDDLTIVVLGTASRAPAPPAKAPVRRPRASRSGKGRGAKALG
jgi:serine phosphatase RsbU (regulator of sigma subunit)